MKIRKTSHCVFFLNPLNGKSANAMGMSVCNQTFLLPQCAARSVGPANQLFIQLIQTLVAAHCSIPQPNIWPEDYGSIAKKHGTVF